MSVLRLSARFYSLGLLTLVCLCFQAGATALEPAPVYELKYIVELQPEKSRARVTLLVDRGDLLQHLSFKVKRGVHSNIKANGKLEITEGRAVWTPPAENARLRFTVKINHERDPGVFDARITKDWAIFRGDDIIPAMFTDTATGALSQASLRFKLPDGWSIETGWPRKSGNTFRIDNPERRFDRPVGWMIAGKLGTRRTQIGNTSLAVSAPQGDTMRRMDALTFLTFVWPEMQAAFRQTPDKLLVVGADDPMWRGGLSASNSIFLHADRPLVSENGTSPLVHELVHMVTRISGVKAEGYGDDWIAEGLAEFYSFELIFRAGAMTRERREQIIARLARWGGDVTYLRKLRSSGPITARAVVLLDELDQELRASSNNKYNLDHLVRALIPLRQVSLDDLRAAAKTLLGKESKTLTSPLLDLEPRA